MRFSKSAAYHCSRARTPLMSRSNLGNWSERGSIAASCDASSKRAVSEFTTSSKHAWNPSQAFGHSRIRSYKIYLLKSGAAEPEEISTRNIRRSGELLPRQHLDNWRLRR